MSATASMRRPVPELASSLNLPLVDIPLASYFRYKLLLGRVVALILLIPALPVIGLLVVLVRLTSPGPGFFRQVRVGQQGRIFLMYKIRTMRRDAESGSGPTWTKLNDPRITPIGRLLRKLHLDELPQLLNVVRGEMSLVGPRPERPEFTAVLATAIPDYLNRLAVPPGITGLAQVNLPPDTDLNSVRRKLALDLEYIRSAGLLLDARLLLYTFIRLLGFSCQFAARLLRLHRTAPLAAACSQSLSPEPTLIQLKTLITSSGYLAETVDYGVDVADLAPAPLHRSES